MTSVQQLFDQSPMQLTQVYSAHCYVTASAGCCRVLEHNLLDGVAAVKAGFDDAQVAALCAALGARPGDLLLLVGGP